MKKIACIVGTHDWLSTESARKPRPRSVIDVLRDRAHVTLHTLEDLESSDPFLYQVLNEREILDWGFATIVLAGDHNYDAILVFGEDAGIPLALYAYMADIHIPIYIVTRGPAKFYPDLPKTRFLNRVHFLCSSTSVRSFFVHEYQLADSQVHCVGCGVDTSYFCPSRPCRSSRFVVSVSTVDRDQYALVECATQLGVPVVIGVDNLRNWSPIEHFEQPWPRNLISRAYRSYEELRNLYSDSLFVVVILGPSLATQAHMVIAEAMAMGKPVIATRTELDSDIILSGKNGYFVPVGDALGLTHTVSTLIDSPVLLNRMAEAARSTVENKCNLEEHVNGLLDLICAD